MRKKTDEDYHNELFLKEIDHWPLEKYQGDGVPIKHECLNGHITLRSPGNVLRGMDCSVCVGNTKRTHEEYIGKLEERGIVYRPVEAYINTDFPIKHECPVGHRWSVRPSHILNGSGCPDCNRVGVYNNTTFSKNRELANSPGLLYLICLIDKKTSEKVCYKIGITKGTSFNAIKKRAGGFKGYTYTVLKKVTGTLEEVFNLEQELHKKWAHKKFYADTKFPGHTELFQIDPEIIKSVPNKL